MFFPNLTFEMEKVKYAGSVGYLILVRSTTLIKYNTRKYNKLLCLITYGSQEWAIPADHYVFLWYEMNDIALADSFLFKCQIPNNFV